MYNQFPGASETYRNTAEEKINIGLIGKTSGLCIIAYVIIQNALTLPLLFPYVRELFKTNSLFQDSVTIFLSVLGLLIPFAVGGKRLEKKLNVNAFPLEKPYDMRLAGFVVFLGFFICLIGDYITGQFTGLIEKTGFKLSQPDFATPDGIIGRLYYILTIAVVPALCEEAAVRGAVMQPLRRYGDKFAIIISSLVFAILHGNLVQFPFALIAGLGLGYAACITGSLWPSIIIHCLNNVYSCITAFMMTDITDTEKLNTVFTVTLYSLYAVSILGSVIFVFIKGRRSLNKLPTYNTAGKKAGAFFGNIPMIISLIIMLIITANYISRV